MVEGSTSHHQQVQAITTLRSGRRVDNHVQEKVDEQTEIPHNLQKDKGKQVNTNAFSSSGPTPEIPYEPRVPFLERLKAPSHFGKQGEKIQDMIEVFKQVKINLPLDAIKQVPAYAKFLKDLCTQKRKRRNHIPKKVLLTEHVSSLIQHNTPPKFKDPGSPTISCIIGQSEIDKVRLNIFNAFQHGPDQNECFFVDNIEEYVEDSLPSLLTRDPLEDCLTYFGSKDFNTNQYIDESPPKLELKPLPDKLKYAFLGSNDTLSVTIASVLKNDQEDCLLAVLKNHKKAIGLTVADLKGIDPSICMHWIHLEEDARPSNEAQRRLNPNMNEVVMTEVVKLLDAGIIYPIFDSKWVSPTQVVPKKSGITVVENSVGELIPQGITTGWRVCIGYNKLNSHTRKDHFPLLFIDKILEHLVG
ncbi:uncharacterized protein LOC133858551 [Alnus glutinosa]|uniref:uncharacterized protein LOC133858551 n=1 Tax=Alnus glutinosa TaxID=3517 RepID=UPI002D76951B|nr:uncharacterized protein LOC133858551 [Alnus glutinosa]